MDIVFRAGELWWLLAIIVYIGVPLLIGWAVYGANVTEYSYSRRSGIATPEEKRRSGKYGLITGLVLFVSLALFVNLCTMSASAAAEREHTATFDQQVQEAFGLEPGAATPLVLGSRIEGTIGEVTGNRFYVSGNFQPSSALSVDFESEGRHAIFELPMSKITFYDTVESPQDATIQIYLEEPRSGEGLSGVTWTDTYDNCYSIFNGFFVNECSVVDTTFTLDPEVDRLGLADVVLTHFKSATINLTKDQYAQILGE